MSEFKVGDFVVFDTTKPFCGQMPDHLMEYIRVSPNCEHDALVWIGNQMFEVGGKAIRPATPEEIKAGRRLDGALTNEGTTETAEMIDYSPACEVYEG